MALKKPAVLTEADIAAIAAGATLESQAGEIPTVPVVDAPAAPAAGAVDAPAAPAVDAPAKPAAEVPAKPANELVSYLQGELATAQTKITAQAIELKAATDKAAAMAVTNDPLVDIARKSVGNMRVALGGSADGIAALGATEVLAEHKRLSEEFTKKFKVGGVAAVSQEIPNKQGQAAADPSHAARVAAARA